MKKNERLTLLILYMSFIVFTLLIKLMDVRQISDPCDMKIGFSTINLAFHDLTGVNMIWHDITEIIGICVLLICGVFAIIGVRQMIMRKGLKNVDRDIIVLGGFYVVVLAVYVLFDKIAINYRPILMDGVSEPSYPSSHTVLAICVLSTAVMQIKKRIDNDMIRNILTAVCILTMIILVIGRLISGVHWLTDIIGGILISAALCYTYRLTAWLT